ncbi:MAG: sigma-70 family RNA polymerase sigma factor [Cyclobacteriaceae bacterium]|nr:sigma-70 family RNA polymerase sigma factor [Cyclobacteriaceae bacterium]
MLDQNILNLHHDLLERCRSGDQDAHYRIYKLYSRSMYNVACRITGREDEAEDVLQESFINAFRNLDNYRGDATFGSWLKRIVVNNSINALKKRRHELLPEDEDFDVAEELEGEEVYKTELTVDKVKRAIESLPDGYRSVLSLYLLEGYDHQEIAEILSITESTSKSQLNRSKKKLKELLTGML